MKTLINKIINKIGFSILENNEHSSIRIQSYILLFPILFMTLIFVGI